MSRHSGEWWENPVLTLFYSCLQGWDRQCFTQWGQERGWQTTVVKGHKEFSGLWSFVAAMGGGSLFKGEGGTLICDASQHKSQVAEPLDHCTMRSTWMVREVGGWEHKWDRKGGGRDQSVMVTPSVTVTWLLFLFLLHRADYTRRRSQYKQEHDTWVVFPLGHSWWEFCRTRLSRSAVMCKSFCTFPSVVKVQRRCITAEA